VAFLLACCDFSAGYCTTELRNVISIRRYERRVSGGGYVSLIGAVQSTLDFLGENFDYKF